MLPAAAAAAGAQTVLYMLSTSPSPVDAAVGYGDIVYSQFVIVALFCQSQSMLLSVLAGGVLGAFCAPASCLNM
jgi:hypothetical protein